MILRTRALSWAAVSPLRRARGLGVRRAVVTITLEPTDMAHGVSTRGIPRDAAADTGLRAPRGAVPGERRRRSEEHTSELQSRPHLVCRLLLEKKKNHRHRTSPN